MRSQPTTLTSTGPYCYRSNGWWIISNQPATDTDDILWRVYERYGQVHVLADVPRDVPREDLGFAVDGTVVVIYVGTSDDRQSQTSLPVRVEPLPVTVAYRNGIFELVFDVADALEVTD